MAAFPDRDQLASGSLPARLANHPWRIEVLPFAASDIGLPAELPQWVPTSRRFDDLLTVWRRDENQYDQPRAERPQMRRGGTCAH